MTPPNIDPVQWDMVCKIRKDMASRVIATLNERQVYYGELYKGVLELSAHALITCAAEALSHAIVMTIDSADAFEPRLAQVMKQETIRYLKQEFVNA